jgi:hypothetical protein
LKLVERVALDNRIGLLQAGLFRKEPASVPHLPRIRRLASRSDHFRFGS